MFQRGWFNHQMDCDTPWKMNGWNLQITNLGKENDLNQTSRELFQPLIFSLVQCTSFFFQIYFLKESYYHHRQLFINRALLSSYHSYDCYLPFLLSSSIISYHYSCSLLHIIRLTNRWLENPYLSSQRLVRENSGVYSYSFPKLVE